MAENAQDAGWVYHSNDQQSDPSQQPEHDTGQTPAKNVEISWTASEFIANHKSPGWYLGFFVVIGIIVSLILLLTKDWISAIAITLVGILFASIANRKPRQLPYLVNNQGVSVGSRFYPYSSFKSFALIHEGAIGSVNFMPLQRLQAELTIYFPPEEEDAIIEVLAEHLPNDQRAAERTLDKFIKKFHF